MIISTAYFPPINHIGALIQEDTFIEAHENFQKHSERNRAKIMTATGVQTLSVPVVGGRGIRRSIRDVEVDYRENFQSQHLKSIMTAYRSAPYYEHFFDKIEPLFSINEKYLFDLNCRITESLLTILKQKSELRFTDDFAGAQTPNKYSETPYYQVFSDRVPFAENLSVLDWIFCNGFLR